MKCDNCLRYGKSCTGEISYCEESNLRIPMTNADRIRAMSDRELARLLCDFKGDCHECPADSYCEHGHNGMLYWLKEEVTH